MDKSFNLKPLTTHVPPYEQMSKEQQAGVDRHREQQAAINREGVAKSRGLSADQRKTLENCPVAQRDDRYDTVY